LSRSRLLTAALLAAALALPAIRGAQPQSAPQRAKVQQALDLLQAGDRQRGETLLREVIAEHPGHGVARFQLGRLTLARGELAEARQHLEVAVSSSLQRPYLAWSLLGRAQLGLGDPESALESFDHCLEAAPRFGPAWLGRARAHLFLGQAKPALADLSSALALPGATPETALLAAQALAYLGRADELPPLLTMIAENPVEDDPATAAAEMLAAALAVDPGATLRLLVLLGRNLSLADGYLALGIHHLRRDEPQAAAAFRIAIELDDGQPIGRLFLQRLEPQVRLPQPTPGLESRFATARRYYEEGRLEEAGKIATRLLAERPHHVPAHLLALRAAEERGDLWAALVGYRQLLEWLPHLPALESRLADVAHAMGVEELAETSVRAALEAFPDDGALHYRLATVLAATGATDDAVAAVIRATALGFDEPQAWLTLGQLHLQRMEISPAIDAYRRALEIDPGAAEILGTFALSSLTTEESSSLLELLERHAAAHPGNGDTQYSLGVMHLRGGRPQEALEYLERAAVVDPERPQVHYNLGQAYQRLGRQPEARAAIDRFNELKSRENAVWEQQNRLHFLRLEAADAAAAGDAQSAVIRWTEITSDAMASPDDRLAMAEALLAADRALQALTWFESVLAVRPYDRNAFAGLADAAVASGNESLARQARQRLALLSPPEASQPQR